MTLVFCPGVVMNTGDNGPPDFLVITHVHPSIAGRTGRSDCQLRLLPVPRLVPRNDNGYVWKIPAGWMEALDD